MRNSEMSKSTKATIIEFLFRWLVTLIANFLVLLDVLRSIITYGKEYFESPTWIPAPSFLEDPKFGKHKIAHLEGVNIHYVESGDPDKHMMLFVHGFPEFWYSWHNQIVEFQKNYRVVALDLRGYGLSDKPQEVTSYKTDLLADDLKHLIEHLGVSQCTMVAHDWGGGIAWNFSQRYPELLKRLVILNCPHPSAFQKVIQSSKKQLLSSWYMFFFMMPYFPEWYLSRMDMKFIEGCFVGKKSGLKKNKMSTEEVQAFKANMMQPGALTAAVNFYRAAFKHPTPNETDEVEVPVLLIWGTEDIALTIDLPRVTQKYCKDITVAYMDGASHWVQQDMPSEVNNAIREFIAAKK